MTDTARRWLAWPRAAFIRSDMLALGLVAAGLAALYLPVFWDLSQTIWRSDEQGHGPIILAVGLWLLWRQRAELIGAPRDPSPGLGWTLFALAMALYVVGRSQNILMFQAASQIPALAALLLLFRGRQALRRAWFPLVFLLFMVPLPATLVATLTTPLKAAVSAVASELLHILGYPIGRTGVVLTVGPYQLLVADACAGLNSMFTLEALGLLYLKLMNYGSAARNAFIAIAVIPIAFAANVIRVVVLVLVTYHFGDAAGQGFVHDFAGMVLFLVALVLILATDTVYGLVTRHPRRSNA